MDMQPENQTASMPTLCRAGCGFYGSSATENLCSKCFKDALKRKQDPNLQAAGSALFSASPSSSSLATAGSMSDEIADLNAEENSDKTTSAVTPPDMATAAASPAPAALSADNPTPPSSSIDQAASVAPSAAAVDETTSVLGGNADAIETATAAASTANIKPRNRCEACNKKVGLTGFECRCGGMFCGAHRYSDMHDCHFDYKSLGAQEIKKNNPVISKEKIQKI